MERQIEVTRDGKPWRTLAAEDIHQAIDELVAETDAARRHHGHEFEAAAGAYRESWSGRSDRAGPLQPRPEPTPIRRSRFYCGATG